MVKVTTKCVDGSMSEYIDDMSLIEKLFRLKEDGYEGRELIEELFTDDWGAPPTLIEIEWTDDHGAKQSEVICYGS